MAGRRAKPVDINSMHMTNSEIAQRKANEERLKGSDNRVYNPPTNMTEEQKDTYRFLVNELHASNILSNLDIVILEQTVECIVKLKEIKQETNELTLAEQRSYTNMYKEYFNMYLKCCGELGLSPASRAKIANAKVVENKNKSDPLLKVLNK